jgi:hypothetical protein
VTHLPSCAHVQGMENPAPSSQPSEASEDLHRVKRLRRLKAELSADGVDCRVSRLSFGDDFQYCACVVDHNMCLKKRSPGKKLCGHCEMHVTKGASGLGLQPRHVDMCVCATGSDGGVIISDHASKCCTSDRVDAQGPVVAWAVRGEDLPDEDEAIGAKYLYLSRGSRVDAKALRAGLCYVHSFFGPEVMRNSSSSR